MNLLCLSQRRLDMMSKPFKLHFFSLHLLRLIHHPTQRSREHSLQDCLMTYMTDKCLIIA